MAEQSNKAMVLAQGKTGWMIVLMLTAGLVTFVAGIFRPFTSVTKLWLFEDEVSVYLGLVTLWKSQEIFLFLILFVFTVCFPFVKINALLTLWLKPGLDQMQAKNLHKFVSHLGKWSMLDVFIVAILVLTIRSGIAEIKVEDGFFLFFLSVMLTQLAAMWTGNVVSHLKD